MTIYRDDREALRARVDTLEDDLADKKREIDQLKGDESTEARIDQLSQALGAAQSELAKLREAVRPAPPPPPRPSNAPLVVLGLMLLAIGGAAVAMLVRRPEPPPPPRAREPMAEAPRFPDAPTPAAPMPTEDPSRTAEPAMREPLDAQWKGRVKEAKGMDLAPGTPCLLKANIESQPKSSFHVSTLEVVCGTRKLYDSSETFSGMSNTSSGLMEEPGAEAGVFQHMLKYEDVGSRSGRNQMALDTRSHIATIVPGGTESFKVTIDVDELDTPQKGDPMFESSRLPVACNRFETGAVVTEAKGATSVKNGAHCKLTLRALPEPNCGVRITCGETVVYGEGGSQAKRIGAIIEDTDFSVADNDPKLLIDLDKKHVLVSDEAVTSWSIAMRLDAAPGNPPFPLEGKGAGG